MRHLILFIAAISMLAGTAGLGHAQLRALSPDELGQVNAKAGMRLLPEQRSIDQSADHIYIVDEDGIGQNKPAFLSPDNVLLKGTLAWSGADPAQIVDILFTPDSWGLSGFSYVINQMDLYIDTLRVDAIRVGAAPGEGPSFGAIGISDMDLRLEGDIRIDSRPGRFGE